MNEQTETKRNDLLDTMRRLPMDLAVTKMINGLSLPREIRSRSMTQRQAKQRRTQTLVVGKRNWIPKEPSEAYDRRI
jgi:hypothetical protein